ncbi:MAG: hypothetical protein O3C43_11980 [Verrucomicrobia bacterium]|nr:hypothetical protein [Verrucomicrobiota bacterium]
MQVSNNDSNILPSLNWPKSGCPNLLQEKKKRFLEVDGVHRMPDFLINLVSPKDQWMYITSNGALTAGRVNSDHALFPYYTQDKLMDLEETTGSFTSIWVYGKSPGSDCNWKPFSKDRGQFGAIERTVYKSPEGDEIIFEETNTTLDLQFSYHWSFSSKYGFVRQIELLNTGATQTKVRILDGLRNLVPHGFNQNFLNRFSNLADAYKKSELLDPEKIGIYYLSSIPTDRAEPSEGLKATVAWSLNYDADQVLLSEGQLDAFSSNQPVSNESDVRGQKSCYLLSKHATLEAGESFQGWIVADIDQDAGEIEQLRREHEDPARLADSLQEDIKKGHHDLQIKLAAADGYQLTNDSRRCSRHLSNVLFNIMRGGIFANNYEISKNDFLRHLQNVNVPAYLKFDSLLKQLPETLRLNEFLDKVKETADSDLLRIAVEYLPLTFSRRHGDPSRPWNAFSIETTDAEGNPILTYQGNWRDIFQNWEALAYSFPEFLQGMIFRFLNATTIDGYNPYRLTKEGVDWEIIEPDEPWSNIGYWGDHQIIYLLKLLELSARYSPKELVEVLGVPSFVCVDVPYKIGSFSEIWKDSRNTVTFDEEKQTATEERVANLGTDGKLLANRDGTILKFSLLEKLLIPLLSKISNFVPEGGIWMNTQRPEWNDANNALVGNGLSVVTLGYIHRYLDFLISFLDNDSLPHTFQFSAPVSQFLERLQQTLSTHSAKLNRPFSDSERYEITEALGQAGSDYREQVYAKDFETEGKSIALNNVLTFFKTTKTWIKHSLDANRREDGLYHSYNLLKKAPNSIGVDYLYEMLEGQVSILSSKSLSANKAADLLDTLRKSSIYQEERNSYMLYPDRALPTFLEKNIIDKEQVDASKIIEHLLKSKNKQIAYTDVRGQVRFNGSFKNTGDLREHLQLLKQDVLSGFKEEEFSKLETIFENTFQHDSFTGRSGTFFAYEGLGSIYWHMVSKLLLAIQENYLVAKQLEADEDIFQRFKHHYNETLEGLGIYQEPAEYGAFPSDAYSHTPKHAGAQQPGMTGQVKEDILIRWGELGIQIRQSCLSFEPKLLRQSEFLDEPAEFAYYTLDGTEKHLKLKSGELAFSYCQTPVVYELSDTSGITVTRVDGSSEVLQNNQLTKKISRAVFDRSGELESIRIRIPENSLLR